MRSALFLIWAIVVTGAFFYFNGSYLIEKLAARWPG